MGNLRLHPQLQSSKPRINLLGCPIHYLNAHYYLYFKLVDNLQSWSVPE
ncbi:hypothetical protein ABTC66_20375 [Acinetobacter baumannii]